MYSVRLRVTEDIGVALQISTCRPRLALKALQICPEIYIKWHQKLYSSELNIARIANAVQVTICLLVSTSVY